jgi:hypothetical protein
MIPATMTDSKKASHKASESEFGGSVKHSNSFMSGPQSTYSDSKST